MDSSRGSTLAWTDLAFRPSSIRASLSSASLATMSLSPFRRSRGALHSSWRVVPTDSGGGSYLEGQGVRENVKRDDGCLPHEFHRGLWPLPCGEASSSGGIHQIVSRERAVVRALGRSVLGAGEETGEKEKVRGWSCGIRGRTHEISFFLSSSPSLYPLYESVSWSLRKQARNSSLSFPFCRLRILVSALDTPMALWEKKGGGLNG